jgi:phospholipid-translocating ATPase
MYYEPLNLPCIPKSWNLADDLGQIEYIFSDKTGTLTRNLMEFKLCSIDGQVYGGPFLKESELNFHDDRLTNLSKAKKEDEPIFDFFRALALCHTVVVGKDQEHNLIYKSQSPDETALVEAAKIVKFTLTNRDLKTITIRVCGEDETYTILHVLEFDSTRKRQSIILKTKDEKIILLCKGADTAIYERLSPGQDQLSSKTAEHLQQFAADGKHYFQLNYRSKNSLCCNEDHSK